MAAEVKMVVVGGVRYRVEDAPQQEEAEVAAEPVEHKMRKPARSSSSGKSVK